MNSTWMGGALGPGEGEERPTVDEWHSVAVPGQPRTFSADGPVAYRTTFADPRDEADERAVLTLYGAYGRVGCWVNGTEVGRHEPHFVPARFAFEPEPENELIVVCAPPGSQTGLYGTDELPAEWGTPGIWWDVDVASRPRTFLRRLEVDPRLEETADEGVSAAIDVSLEVDAGAAVDDAVTLSVRPEGFRGGGTMHREPIDAAAGDRETVSTTLEVRDPKLWWPRGHGPQHRYAIRAKLGADSLERTVGFRRVERDADGLLVNGGRVRARGFTRLPGGDPADDVERALEANATLLRARGHVPPRAFYAACDEAGLLVWQDLPVGTDDLSTERATSLAETIRHEYGRHPSLSLFGVQDRPTDRLSLGSGLLAKLRLRYRAWRRSVDHGPAEAVADSLPDDVPAVATVGGPGTGADASSLAPGWRYLEAGDVEWLLERYPSMAEVVAGFGAGSLTDDDADPASIPGLEAGPLERRADDAAASQAHQVRTLKTVAEALRRRECGVLAAATLRDVASGGGMGVLARDGEAKPAYDAVADSFEPVQAVLDGPPEPGTVGITLCNDTPEAREATVGWRAGDRSGQTDVAVGPLETAPAGQATVPADASRVALEVVLADRSVTNRYELAP